MIEETAFYPKLVEKIATGGGMEHSHFAEIREVEIGQIELRYTHTRVARPEMVSSLVSSIERSGQIVPVITAKESDFCFVLIDGYLKAAALKRCREDTVLAEIWACKEAEALIRVLMRSHERRWEMSLPNWWEKSLTFTPVHMFKCYAFWKEHGTDCSNCIGVCPFNKPESWVHKAARILIGAKSGLINNLILKLDAGGYSNQANPQAF